MMFMRLCLLFSLFAAASGNLRSGPRSCDGSFPLTTPHPRGDDEHHGPRLVAIHRNDEGGKYYETGEYYAPLCPDGRHIDIRRLKTCNSGSCWNEDINQCTFECIWNTATQEPTKRPTPSPTPKPSFAITDTLHAAQIRLKNIPQGYIPNAEVRSYIVRFVTKVLEMELGEELELIRVEYAGRLKPSSTRSLEFSGLFDSIAEGSNNNNEDSRFGRFNQEEENDDDNKGNNNGRHLLKPIAHLSQRRLASVSVPLKITIRGPEDVSHFALSYIMDILRANLTDMLLYLRQHSGSLTANFNYIGGASDNVFADLELDADTYDYEDIGTLAPTRRPTTTSPTAEAMEEENVMTIKVTDEITTIPWWVWLTVALVILLCCICCCCLCWWRHSKDANEDGDDNYANSKQKQINIHLQNQLRPRHRKKDRVSRGRPIVESRKQERFHHRSTKDSVSRGRPIVGHRSTRSRRSEKTRASRPPIRTPEVAIPAIPVRDDELAMIPWQNTPAVKAVAALDPPEERALVLYNPNQAQENRVVTLDQVEPEGDKADRKESLFADAQLMNEVHRERRSALWDKKREANTNKLKKTRRLTNHSENGMIVPNGHFGQPDQVFGDQRGGNPLLTEPKCIKVDKNMTLLTDSQLEIHIDRDIKAERKMPAQMAWRRKSINKPKKSQSLEQRSKWPDDPPEGKSTAAADVETRQKRFMKKIVSQNKASDEHPKPRATQEHHMNDDCRLKDSLNWKKNMKPIEMEDMSDSDTNSDSPSLLTVKKPVKSPHPPNVVPNQNFPPDSWFHEAMGASSERNDKYSVIEVPGSQHGISDSVLNESEGQTGEKGSVFASVKHRSFHFHFNRDGVSSDSDQSPHLDEGSED